MSIKAVLFDLDGTLLPMDQDKFIMTYLSALAEYIAPYGYEPKTLMKNIFKFTMAMVINDGKCTNEDVFWNMFTAEYGKESLSHTPHFDRFYKEEFNKFASVCGYNEEAKDTVTWLKERGVRVVLATNPVFPMMATERRIAWTGLDKSDFELVTTYENSKYCKPNVEYYRAILEETGLSPEDCLMVGNDVADDMVAESLGMKVFLLTDCLINSKNEDISKYPSGGFGELREFIKTN